MASHCTHCHTALHFVTTPTLLGCGFTTCIGSDGRFCTAECLAKHQADAVHVQRRPELNQMCAACRVVFEDRRLMREDFLPPDYIPYCTIECRVEWQKQRVCERVGCDRVFQMEPKHLKGFVGCGCCMARPVAKRFCSEQCSNKHDRQVRRPCLGCTTIFSVDVRDAGEPEISPFSFSSAAPARPGPDWCSPACVDKFVNERRKCKREGCSEARPHAYGYTLMTRHGGYRDKTDEELAFCSNYCFIAQTKGVDVATSQVRKCAWTGCPHNDADDTPWIPNGGADSKEQYCSIDCATWHTAALKCEGCQRMYSICEGEYPECNERYCGLPCREIVKQRYAEKEAVEAERRSEFELLAQRRRDKVRTDEALTKDKDARA